MKEGFVATATNERLLTLNHEIRIAEHSLNKARNRRKQSNFSFAFGPILLIILYGIAWIHAIPRIVLAAVYIPAAPVVVGFIIAAFYLKWRPGFPDIDPEDGSRIYVSEGDLELKLARLRDTKKVLLADANTPTKVRRVAYKEDAGGDI